MAELSITAQAMKQHGYTLYLFPMSSGSLKRLCYVTPKSKENPEEVQRFRDEKRAKDIGEYIKQDGSVLPNAIVISLTDAVTLTKTGKSSEVILKFPSESGKFGYILDGQHRLAGFDFSDGVEFDLPVVAFHQADEHLRGKVFADINSKQVKVSNVHILNLYYQIKELPQEEASTMDVVQTLAADADSPLKDRIKLLDDQKDTWVTNRHMKQCLAPWLESGGPLHGKNAAQQAKIMKEYLKGVRATWSTAWGDNANYMLTKAMGIEIAMSIFQAAKHRCDLNYGKQYTSDSFEKSLSPLKSLEIEMPGGGMIPLSWERGTFGALSNKVGKKLINRQLTNALVEADDDG